MQVQVHPTYEELLSTFRVDELAGELSGSIEGSLNVCYECCDRHATQDKIALYWQSKDGRSATYTFAELQGLSARFANFLYEQGIRPGDRVAGLLPRIPELLVVILGVWRCGAVYLPLFTAFGPKALESRLGRSGAKLIVTDAANRPKLYDVAGLPLVMTITSHTSDRHTRDLNFWDEVTGSRKALHLSCEPQMTNSSSNYFRHYRPAQGHCRPYQSLTLHHCLHALWHWSTQRRHLLECSRSWLGLWTLSWGRRRLAAWPLDLFMKGRLPLRAPIAS